MNTNYFSNDPKNTHESTAYVYHQGSVSSILLFTVLTKLNRKNLLLFIMLVSAL